MLDVSCRKDYTGAIKIMEVQCNMKLAFFDTKPYDKPGFDEHIAGTDIEIKYFETRLGEDTVQLAKGFDGVCVFVNDTVNEKVINELYDLGVRVIALRCAGFNNVDTKACFGKLHVFRVPAYSPYAVAEHAMALLLTVNRHTNKAYIRTRDFNFSLSGLTGFDLHGKTVGVVGESGCGKSVTSLSLMQLLQRPQGQVVEGEIRLNLGDKAYDVTKTPDSVMQHLRGNFVSMIFQEPMTALNPVFRIGDQLDEGIAPVSYTHLTLPTT